MSPVSEFPGGTPPIVVITGASSGIGAALAGVLGARGASLVLVARRRELLEAVARRSGPEVLVIATDVTRREAVRDVVPQALARFGRIDVWVNNVGQGVTALPSHLTDDDLDIMMQVNVKSALYGMQEILPHFTARGTGQIINISSMLGRIPFALPRAAYTGAKHFLNALTAGFRDELHETHPGITVTLVSPGVVATDFGLNALHGGVDSRQLPQSQPAAEVARVIADAIVSRRTDLYTRSGSHARVLQYYQSQGEDP